MSDRHVRILMMMARRSQRRVDRDETPTSTPSQRRDDLVDAAQQTRRRFLAARTRRAKAE